MSIMKGGVMIAGATQCVPDLFDWKWADHKLNDVSWLRADTFSWQDGGVYEAAYDHLEADITGKSLQTETVAGTTISFYLADDGHKICPASEESNVAAIYNATGVAWYYIIDTVNEKFKLPRTKHNVVGLRDAAGNYVEAGLPNLTGGFNASNAAGTSNRLLPFRNVTGVFKTKSVSYNDQSGASTGSGTSTISGLEFDASEGNSIYGNSTTVQPPATQMYLYFFVGLFTKTALENTAGLNASLFNGKVDVGHEVIAFQAPTAENNYTWYRKYADGWVEQGGYADGTVNYSSNPISLPITMADTNYVLVAISNRADKSAYIQSKTTTGFCVKDRVMADIWYDSNFSGSWEVRGMAAV